jgi:hypothetical protein
MQLSMLRLTNLTCNGSPSESSTLRPENEKSKLEIFGALFSITFSHTSKYSDKDEPLQNGWYLQANYLLQEYNSSYSKAIELKKGTLNHPQLCALCAATDSSGFSSNQVLGRRWHNQ